MENIQEKFHSWAVVEIMGHIKCAGLATTMTFGNTVMLRVDIPETTKHPAHTKMYGMSSIFSITPVTEEIAKAHAEAWNINPIVAYEVQQMLNMRFNQEIENAVTKRLKQLDPSQPESEDDIFGDDGF